MTVPHARNPPPEVTSDGGLGFRTVVGEVTPADALLTLIAKRIRVAAGHLGLGREELQRIFSRHTIFEGKTAAVPGGPPGGFLIVETHHLIQGMVGKGALKIVFPPDLVGKATSFKDPGDGVVEVRPPDGVARWEREDQAEDVVKGTMREFMTGESLSMSLKSQATGAPFGGSEGLMLCAVPEFDGVTGRYFLKPALKGGDADALRDKELIESMMNATAEALTQAGRIGYDRIVHAAETNSTLTARLHLQLPTNVVEGHLRALLQGDPGIIIGDEDMTARLRELLERKEYKPNACALARAAALMQMEHAIFLPASREKLRFLLAQLPAAGSPTPSQYREIVDLFFGSSEIQRAEDQLCHHREPILRALSTALSTRCLEECGDAEVLALYLKTLLDNQRIMMEAALKKRLQPGEPLAVDWLDSAFLLSLESQEHLAALVPPCDASRECVQAGFRSTVDILTARLAEAPKDTRDLYWMARHEVLTRAIRAITSAGDVIPPVDRILFFTLPYTYECVTPRLGVVTRKPVEVCGSELRPEAMAVGAVMAIEILLRRQGRKGQPFSGMAVAIEGMGNAGKHVVRLMVEKGATIVGVSDSRGAVLRPGGLTREDLAAIISHKDSGRRLDTYVPAGRNGAAPEGASVTFHADPEILKWVKADILVLSAIPASVHRDNAPHLQASIVCELTGAAVTGEAKEILKQRRIDVIPDNIASSGGLLVSLSEMLQNSAGQVWDRALEEENLYEQLAASFESAWKLAKRFGVDLPTASDILALQRMREIAVYRDQLETLAARLAERIRKLGPDENVLVVSDDDEDGVASAAILQGLISELNPGAQHRTCFLNASFRSETILEAMQEAQEQGRPVSQVFVLDRSFPLSESGQRILTEVAGRCVLTLINNHDLPPDLLDPVPGANAATASVVRSPADLNILLISPQTLRSTVPARDFPTAMILRELAHQLVTDERVLSRIDWQAAVGSCLDAAAERHGAWRLFYTQFNPDRTWEAARALRTVTRAGGFQHAIQAIIGVLRPDQLQTNETWQHFVAQYEVLDERLQVLVEKIILENRRRPFTAHFFTPDEVTSPTPILGNESNQLEFYHWISEHLTQRGDLGDKPIIVGQLILDPKGRPHLGVRIRSPRGVELMEAGLPAWFKNGGLPNTAVARVPLDAGATPEQQFQRLVDAIWMKASSPLILGSIRRAAEGNDQDALARPTRQILSLCRSRSMVREGADGGPGNLPGALGRDRP